MNALISFNTKRKDKALKITIYQSKYFNNIIEQEHRFVKRLTHPMMEFKSFYPARATLAGIAPCHRLGQGQYPGSDSTPAWVYFYSLAE